VSDAQAEEQAAQQRVQQLDQEEARDLNVAWQSQVEEAATRYADFQKVVTNPELPVPEHVATMIKTSPKGPDVAYWLGTNIEAARQIARMSPVEAARVIGRIEASLTLPKPRSETAAPPPVTPVRGAARAAPDPEKLSMADYIEARRSGKIR
jgi:hypothetical protein